MNSKQGLFALMMLFSPLTIFCQSIIGKISDYDKTISYQIALFNASDTTLAKIALCDSLGNFEFGPLKLSTYFLRIENDLGDSFQKDSLEISSMETVIDLHAVKLTSGSLDLAEVEVTPV